MGESKSSEILNLEFNNIFIDKSEAEVENNKMNDSISSTASLLDEPLLKPPYDAQVKEENLAFFPQDRSLSPIFPQSKPLKQEFEDYPEKFLNNEEIPPESDEETIATFITAAGQQLALYAVEDSEEIFAVAVYDESGLPPTDFQFLMKSDVEKLIGEGAIRTVKKPSQLKNQVYAVDHSFTSSEDPPPSSPPPLIETPQKSTSPPSLTPLIKQEKFENFENSKEIENFENSKKLENFENSEKFEDFENSKKLENFENSKKIENFEISKKLDNFEISEKFENFENPQNFEISKKIENFENPQKLQISPKNSNSPERQFPPQFIYENWADNVILLIQNDTILAPKNPDLNEPKFSEIDNELMEKSTVQYILSDDPPDSSDLTLDDIEHLLGEKNDHPPSFPSPPPFPSPPDQSEEPVPLSDPLEGSLTPPAAPAAEKNVKIEKIPAENRFSDDLSEQDDKNEENNAKENKSPESVDILRIKRPRKQQLTAVNRADSEIIIQQTTIASIDENSEASDYEKRKKRGRRRKKKEIRPKNRPYMRTRRRSVSHPKNRKKYRIEVIDLDLDDGEIINLEEIKEKGSSDKENEIIMVGDSDDDDDDEEGGEEEEEVEIDDSDDSDYEGGEVKRSRRRSSPRKLEIFECKNCRKKFKKKEEFVGHGRLCKKVEERIRRGPMRSVRLLKGGEGRGKKDYECKICHERFEVVVALARHVRLMHSLRKRGEGEEEGKGRGKKGERRKRGVVIVEEEKGVERRKRKERQEKIRRIVKNPSTRKINCRECGRWFQGLGLLLAHSLQHATKKIVSEKSRVRRCQLCKKIFKSRFLFICHMRMHSNIVPLRRNHMRTIKQTDKSKKNLKKRGKPQKL